MWSITYFSKAFLVSQFFLLMWIAFFLIGSIVVLDHCIAASRGVSYIQFHHSVSVSVYNVLLVLLLSLCISSWRSFQFMWNSTSLLFLWAQYIVFHHQHIPQFVQPFPNWKTFFVFQSFCHHKEGGYKYFLYRLIYLWSLWGIGPAVVWLGRRADSHL